MKDKKQSHLRFKDVYGNDFPDWEFLNGNVLFENISDKQHNSDLPILAITQEHGAIPRDMIDYKISVTDASVSQYKVVRKGDFIISLRSFQGGIEYSNYNGICSPAYIILRPSGKLDGLFYKYFFKTDNYIQALNKTLEGIRDGKMISYKYFSNVKIPFPCIEEQKKIADFLSAIDEKIEKLEVELEQLKLYKKGVMQAIFAVEAEAVSSEQRAASSEQRAASSEQRAASSEQRLKIEGKQARKKFRAFIRFKDDNGKDFPEWEEKKLRDISIINPKSEMLPDIFTYIDLESVEKGKLLKQEKIEKVNAPSRAQRLLKKMDILFQIVRPYQKNNFLFLNDQSDFVASTGYAQIRTKQNPFFLYQLLLTDDFVGEVIEKCTGTSYPAINSTALSNIRIKIPSLKEQTKIANFLSAIDEKINAVSSQIDKTETWKKGLLQKMFV